MSGRRRWRGRGGALALGLVAAAACASEQARRPTAAVRPLPGLAPPQGAAGRPRLDARWRAVEVELSDGREREVRAFLSQPSLRLFLPREGAPPQDGRPERGDDRVFQAGAVPEQLREVVALDLERFTIRSGALQVVDLARGTQPLISIERLELGIENAATRLPFLEGLPTLLTARGEIGRSGELQAFVSASPFGRALDFSGRAAILDLDLRDLSPLLAPVLGLRTPQGRLDLFVVFSSRAGRIEGAIKVVARGVEVESARGGFFGWLKANTVDLVVNLLSSRDDQPDALATVIPISGRLGDLSVQVWPAVFGLLYNAFVAGFEASFAGLPPAEAPERRSPLEQGWRVLVGREVPRAQPTPPPGGPRVWPRPVWRAERGRVPIAVSLSGLLLEEAERRLQRALVRRGLLSADQVSGRLDDLTRRALRRVQAAAGLAETGLPSYATVTALGLGPEDLFLRACWSQPAL